MVPQASVGLGVQPYWSAAPHPGQKTPLPRSPPWPTPSPRLSLLPLTDALADLRSFTTRRSMQKVPRGGPPPSPLPPPGCLRAGIKAHLPGDVHGAWKCDKSHVRRSFLQACSPSCCLLLQVVQQHPGGSGDEPQVDTLVNASPPGGELRAGWHTGRPVHLEHVV